MAKTIKIKLTENQFNNLVRGKEVSFTKENKDYVMILADIGFVKMIRSISDAHQEALAKEGIAHTHPDYENSPDKKEK